MISESENENAPISRTSSSSPESDLEEWAEEELETGRFLKDGESESAQWLEKEKEAFKERKDRSYLAYSTFRGRYTAERVGHSMTLDFGAEELLLSKPLKTLILNPEEGDVAMLEEWRRDLDWLEDFMPRVLEEARSRNMEDDSRVKSVREASERYEIAKEGLRVAEYTKNLHLVSYGHLLDMTTEPDLSSFKGQYTLGQHLSGDQLETNDSVIQLFHNKDGKEKLLGYLKTIGALHRIAAARLGPKTQGPDYPLRHHHANHLENLLTYVYHPEWRRQLNDRESLGQVTRIRHGTICSQETGLSFKVTVKDGHEKQLMLRGTDFDNHYEWLEWFQTLKS